MSSQLSAISFLEYGSFPSAESAKKSVRSAGNISGLPLFLGFLKKLEAGVGYLQLNEG